MSSGGKPVEGGYLIFTDTEKEEFLKKNLWQKNSLNALQVEKHL